MKILLTGFNPFDGGVTNVSEVLVNAAAAGWQRGESHLVTAVLPTEFDRAGRLIVELIDAHQPDAVVCCGLANHESSIRFERIARNWDACDGTDNAGDCRAGSIIIPGGSAEYTATLPYDRIAVELSRRSIPYRYSDDAGGFVCNHVFYRACHAIAERAAPATCGFIHWPAAMESESRGLPLAVSLTALSACLDHVAASPRRVHLA